VTQHAPRLNFIIQEEPKGLGHAVLMAKDYIDGPFAVILPDDLILDGVDPGALSDMVQAYKGGISIAAMVVPDADTKKYGIFSFPQTPDTTQPSLVASGIVEKPKTNAPSNMAAIGRYILPLSVMNDLVNGKPGAGGEIQLTDALDRVRATGEELHAVRFKGTRYDCGDPLGFIRAQNTVSDLLMREMDPDYTIQQVRQRLGHTGPSVSISKP
jgi:UTP--glucose-1-phosphate uridylyltransferase